METDTQTTPTYLVSSSSSHDKSDGADLDVITLDDDEPGAASPSSSRKSKSGQHTQALAMKVSNNIKLEEFIFIISDYFSIQLCDFLHNVNFKEK